jgi:hypothetical protein
MKFLLAGTDILVEGTIADWRDFAATRWNQGYRSAVGEALRHVAAQIYSGDVRGVGVGRWSEHASLAFQLEPAPSREDRNERVRALRIIADQVSNNAASGGSVAGLDWHLELAAADDSEAA